MIEARTYSIAQLQHAYNRRSWLYSKVVAPMEIRQHGKAIEAARLSPGDKVLEVATGPGHSLVNLAGMVGRQTTIYGMDLSPGMLKLARKKMQTSGFEDFVLEQGDCRALPFESNGFDVLYNGYMFDLIPMADMAGILAEFKRVLKPGGRLVLLNKSKAKDRLNLHEFIYRYLPAKMVLYFAGGCRPVMMASEVRSAGFRRVERAYLAGRFPSEIVTATKEVG